eukprot:6183179-Pleurochrysis_carterae.AAC.3
MACTVGQGRQGRQDRKQQANAALMLDSAGTTERLVESKQIELNKLKRHVRINNELYFRAHPELDQMIKAFVATLLESKPDDVRGAAQVVSNSPHRDSGCIEGIVHEHGRALGAQDGIFMQNCDKRDTRRIGNLYEFRERASGQWPHCNAVEEERIAEEAGLHGGRAEDATLRHRRYCITAEVTLHRSGRSFRSFPEIQCVQRSCLTDA